MSDREASLESQPLVLVADDEPAVRRLFARALADAGFATVEAADGQEAMELITSRQLGLVLLDSTMPRLDGIGVIRAIRARASTRTLPIILVTARADLDDRIAGLEAGADDYLPKPVELTELVARVRAQVRAHGAWTSAFVEETEQRRRLASSIREVSVGAPPELTAKAVAERLVEVLEIGSLAVFTVTPDGSLAPLAVAGEWAAAARNGQPFRSQVESELRALVSGGTFVRRFPKDAAGWPFGGLAIGVPLLGSAGILGLMLFGPRGEQDDARIARRVPIWIEAADLTAALVRPGLEASDALERARSAVRGILADQAFVTHFQPIVRLSDDMIAGHEALTRFQDGIRPDLHFAEANRLGLGSDLEMATLEAAIRAARRLPGDGWLGLNVSPSLVLANLGLADLVTRSDREVVVELTEHAEVERYDDLRTALALLGPTVSVAVDDAGSGYASLRHILALLPAYVKLDLSWVRDIEHDRARQALVAGLVHFAEEVGCQLIGEGVETEAERATLERLGVPFGQGYLLGRPAAAPS